MPSALSKCAALAAVPLMLIAFAAPAAAAQEPPDAFHPLSCEEARTMPRFVPAVVKEKPPPRYPRDALDSWSEGWALLEYAIRADGSVHKVAVADALGPKAFAEASAKRIQTWRFQPATLSGVPVDQFLRQTSVLYLFEDSGRASEHPEFARKYNQARRAIQDRDFDTAIAVLGDALAKRVNLYEEAMGSLVLAIAHAQKGNWQTALFHARHATIEDGNYLEKSLKTNAYALQVDLEARAGNFIEARCAFKELQTIDPAAAKGEGQAAAIMARIDAALKDNRPLVLAVELAKHPMLDIPAAWRHQLLRSKFAFADVRGDVKSFRLACLGTEHEAPVDTEIQWNVPADAGDCILRVDGSPGATFKLVEEW